MKLMSSLLLLITLLFSSTAFTRILDVQLSYFGNPTIDVEHYAIQAIVNELPPKEIAFNTLITLKLLTASDDVELHVQKDTLTVTQIELNNQKLAFEYLVGIPNEYGISGDVLSIKLPRIMNAAEKIVLKLKYTVQKSDWLDDKGIFYIPADQNFGQQLLITRNWPYYARFWLPSNDSPDDVASVEYDIQVPKGYTVAANGAALRINQYTNGMERFHWKQNQPTTTYNYVFAVGAFDVLRKRICYNEDGKINDRTVNCANADKNIPFVFNYNKNNPDSDAAIEQVEKANHAAVYFSKLLGPYLFDKVGYVLSPIYPFAMESTSMIVLYGPNSTVHEVLHHWWGNNVHIPHWGDFWISEGFTTYFDGLYDEYKTGTNTACLTNPSEALNYPRATDPNDILTNTPYCKGAFALHNLRVRITLLTEKNGTKIFMELMRALYTQKSLKTLSTEELVQFVDSKLVSISKMNGVKIDQTQVSTLVQKWKKAWFVTYK